MNEDLDMLYSLLYAFSSISLKEMKKVSLMNRTDTKYLLPAVLLPKVLELAVNEYHIQEINGKRSVDYSTIYFDTEDYAMYRAHAIGRKVREKIRVRTYVDSGLTFLEVKNKNNKGRTDKQRIKVQGVSSLKEDGGDVFLRNNSWYELSQVRPLLESGFQRVTLANKNFTERITIDCNVRFRQVITGQKADLEGIAIVEVKRGRHSYSPMADILHSLHVNPASLSKYCVGIVLTGNEVRWNRFKPTLRLVSKLAGNENRYLLT